MYSLLNVEKKTKINYFTTSRTINSDYKKIKKEVLVVAAEEQQYFLTTSPASVGHTVEKHPPSIFKQKKTSEAKTTFVF
jgi:hypothetical protein